MPFTSYQDLRDKITQSGKFWLATWTKAHGTTAGVANSWATMWALAGHPPAGDYSGTALEGRLTNETTTGALFHGGNVSPETKHLVGFSALTNNSTGIPGIIIVYDRLLYYPGISASTTSTQTLTNPNPITRYTTGDKVMMWLEVTTALGTGTGVFTCSYTNQAGTAGQTLGATVNTIDSSIVGRIPHAGTTANTQHLFLPLAAGDTGVRSVQSVTFTTAHSTGVVALVLGVPLAYIPLATVNVMSERELVLQMSNLERVYDGACLSFLYFHSGALTASTAYLGNLSVAWG